MALKALVAEQMVETQILLVVMVVVCQVTILLEVMVETEQMAELAEREVGVDVMEIVREAILVHLSLKMDLFQVVEAVVLVFGVEVWAQTVKLLLKFSERQLPSL